MVEYAATPPILPVRLYGRYYCRKDSRSRVRDGRAVKQWDEGPRATSAKYPSNYLCGLLRLLHPCCARFRKISFHGSRSHEHKHPPLTGLTLISRLIVYTISTCASCSFVVRRFNPISPSGENSLWLSRRMSWAEESLAEDRPKPELLWRTSRKWPEGKYRRC
jgi:hypothetical protein